MIKTTDKNRSINRVENIPYLERLDIKKCFGNMWRIEGEVFTIFYKIDRKARSGRAYTWGKDITYYLFDELDKLVKLKEDFIKFNSFLENYNLDYDLSYEEIKSLFC